MKVRINFRDLAAQWLFALIFVLVFLLATEATMAVRYSREMHRGAQSPPAKYTPSEIQTLRLQVKQKDAMIAQRDYVAAQQRFQGAVNELNAEADRVKTENGWPRTLLFNSDSLLFSEPPPPPAPAKK
jgi:hypothetical protein